MANDPTSLVFDQPPVPTPGAVHLAFGDGAPEPVVPGVHLVFSRPPVTTPGPVRLVFGDGEGDTPAPAVPDATLHGAGTITGLRLHFTARTGAQLAGGGRITGLRLHIAAQYDINVSRPTVGGAAARWQDAAPLPHATRSTWQQSAPLPVGQRSRWQDAMPLLASTRAVWHDTRQLQRSVRSAFEQALRLPAAPVRSRFQESQRLHTGALACFQEAIRLPAAPLQVRFQETLRDRQAHIGARFEVAVHLSVPIASGMGIAVRLPRAWGGRFQQAWAPRPGQWKRPVPPDAGEPCYLPALPVHLVFAEPFDASLPARLVFVCERHGPGPEPEPEPGVVVPVKRVYIVINDATLHRVDGNIPLPTFGMSMSLDTDSWTWGFNATIHHAALPNLAPSSFGDPVELEARINGVPYRFLAEQISTDRTFGQWSLRVSGRGLAATLDAPYAPVLNFGNTAERTAQQLMADALTVNGVPFGWDVDWQIADWLVPANVWTHQGTYIGALNSIVQAAGGYLQPHGVDKTLKALLRYPSAPWEWGAAPIDFELPAAATVQEGISWQENPRYNRVFVSGTSAGVLGQVTRAGTDGSLVAPMVTDALIAHEIAARQRAIAALAPSGRQAKVTLKLPVLGSTGIIPPGKMVRYVDGATTRVGITRGVQVDVQTPEIFQQIEVETYA